MGELDRRRGPPAEEAAEIAAAARPPDVQEAAQPRRKDDGMSTVIINAKRLKKTAKFQLSEIPYPYRSREEYERAISGSIGREWNTIHGAKEMSRPAILVRAGKIIQPIAMKAKKKVARAPAKF
jgi:U3 small nucleolar RNA-associated protein 14